MTLDVNYYVISNVEKCVKCLASRDHNNTDVGCNTSHRQPVIWADSDSDLFATGGGQSGGGGKSKEGSH